MSWGEVKKAVNTDINEPLNYLAYIHDIKAFGDESFVMRSGNRRVFLELITKSVLVFGDDTIKETIYNSLTNDDVDFMLANNQKIGQALNLWYDTDIFPNQPMPKIAITTEMNSVVDEKIASGFSRYVENILSAEEGVGSYLNDAYALGSDSVASCQSMDDIANNENALKIVWLSDAVGALDSSDYAMDKIFNSATALSVLLHSAECCDKIPSLAHCQGFANAPALAEVVTAWTDWTVSHTVGTAEQAHTVSGLLLCSTISHHVARSDTTYNSGAGATVGYYVCSGESYVDASTEATITLNTTFRSQMNDVNTFPSAGYTNKTINKVVSKITLISNRSYYVNSASGAGVALPKASYIALPLTD